MKDSEMILYIIVSIAAVLLATFYLHEEVGRDTIWKCNNGLSVVSPSVLSDTWCVEVEGLCIDSEGYSYRCMKRLHCYPTKTLAFNVCKSGDL